MSPVATLMLCYAMRLRHRVRMYFALLRTSSSELIKKTTDMNSGARRQDREASTSEGRRNASRNASQPSRELPGPGPWQRVTAVASCSASDNMNTPGKTFTHPQSLVSDASYQRFADIEQANSPKKEKDPWRVADSPEDTRPPGAAPAEASAAPAPAKPVYAAAPAPASELESPAPASEPGTSAASAPAPGSSTTDADEEDWVVVEMPGREASTPPKAAPLPTSGLVTTDEALLGPAPTLLEQWCDKGTISNCCTFAAMILGMYLKSSADAAALGGGAHDPSCAPPRTLYQAFAGLVLAMGLFGFAGGITNWLAIKMLFDPVCDLPGSGVIPRRFKEIRQVATSDAHGIVHQHCITSSLSRAGGEGHDHEDLLRRGLPAAVHEREDERRPGGARPRLQAAGDRPRPASRICRRLVAIS